MLTAQALDGLPEVEAGADLAAILSRAMPADRPRASDVLVLAHKIISKSEGRTRSIAKITPTPRAQGLATLLDRIRVTCR